MNVKDLKITTTGGFKVNSIYLKQAVIGSIGLFASVVNPFNDLNEEQVHLNVDGLPVEGTRICGCPDARRANFSIDLVSLYDSISKSGFVTADRNEILTILRIIFSIKDQNKTKSEGETKKIVRTLMGEEKNTAKQQAPVTDFLESQKKDLKEYRLLLGDVLSQDDTDVIENLVSGNSVFDIKALYPSNEAAIDGAMMLVIEALQEGRTRTVDLFDNAGKMIYSFKHFQA